MNKKISDTEIQEDINNYIDWLFGLSNGIECSSLDEADNKLMDKYTFEECSKILKYCNVNEEQFTKAKEKLQSVKGKLTCYCCGSPIINAFDEDVRKVIDSATEILFETYLS